MANIASDKKELNWAVLGTGVIANQMASALADMGRQLYGVANRTYEKAVEYYGAAEPPVRCGESHLSGLTEPPIDSYSA